MQPLQLMMLGQTCRKQKQHEVQKSHLIISGKKKNKKEEERAEGRNLRECKKAQKS